MNVSEKLVIIENTPTVFQQITPNVFSVEKDDTGNFSTGSKISSKILDYFVSITENSESVAVFRI